MLAAYDLALRTPTPIAGSHSTYEWTPDGKRVYFTMAGASHKLLVQRADGSDSSSVMYTAAGESVHEFVMSPDQRSLLIVVGRGLGKFDIMMAAIHGDTTLRPFQVTAANELLPTFSADGHWVAFVSDASGRNEVYVSAFPGPGGRVLVSENGGNEPVWSHAGRTLYYRSGRRMIAATMDAAGGAVTRRTTLFEGDFQGNCDIRCYDVAPDDKQFVMGRLKTKPDIVIWTNWLDELRAKMRAPQ
jgi:Tol biopolymer transport system component